MSNFARIRSDYSPNTCMSISMSDDGDISLKIYGEGEMRIATSGGHLHGEKLNKVIEAFSNVINTINDAREDGEQMPDREKIIKDLEECLSASCRGFRPRQLCPYNDEEWDIMRDALALLKEQQAKIDELIKEASGYAELLIKYGIIKDGEQE